MFPLADIGQIGSHDLCPTSVSFARRLLALLRLPGSPVCGFRESHSASIGRSSVRTREEIEKADGMIAAEAGSVIVPRDVATGRSRPLGEAELSALRKELNADSERVADREGGA